MREDNAPLDLARDIVETTDRNLFLTGKAGTGKTTFLRRLRHELPKRMVVLAPTGIAAINAEGVTIHSFFQLPFTLFLPDVMLREEPRYSMTRQKIKLIRSLDLLVIDEVSMVRCDLLDAVDSKLRKLRRDNRPFGGLQTLLIGDLHQLSPVVREEDWELMKRVYDTPYFFSAKAFKEGGFLSIELEHVYRQTDTSFLSMLNELREGRAGKEVIDKLNERYIAGYQPDDADDCIRLVTHNWQAQRINDSKLEQLPAKAYTYSAQIKGKFPEMSYPTERELVLKEGAQVMFVKNDVQKRYCNGTIATIVAAREKSFEVKLTETGKRLEVMPEEWMNARYALDEKTGEIKEVVDGRFMQFPVKLAWAITIHKSQGLTFDHVMIDAANAFAHGQTYVALSRCKTLEGIVLTAPLTPTAVIVDRHVSLFDKHVHEMQIDKACVNEMRKDYSVHLIEELFLFEKERIYLAQVHRLFDEHLVKTYPETTRLYKERLREFDLGVMSVSSKFHTQYQRMLQQNGGFFEDDLLQERLKKGSAYFAGQLERVADLLNETKVDIDNKEVAKRMKESVMNLREAIDSHLSLLKWVFENGFSQKAYLTERAKVLLGAAAAKEGKEKRKNAKVNVENLDTLTSPAEVKNAKLYAALQNWRKEKATELGVPAYVVLQTKAMIGMANVQPLERTQLMQIPYFGKKGYEKYGKELLEIINRYAHPE